MQLRLFVIILEQKQWCPQASPAPRPGPACAPSPSRTVDHQVLGLRHLGGLVAGGAGVAAVVLGGQALDQQNAIVLVDAVGGGPRPAPPGPPGPRVHRLPILAPHQLQWRVARHHRARDGGAVADVQRQRRPERAQLGRRWNKAVSAGQSATSDVT